jgi:spermidine synthase
MEARGGAARARGGRLVKRPWVIVACLVFSGLTALVYQIVWARLLGLAFGTTTEAISTVLAVFFGGLALGNLLAARGLARVQRPLRVYAWLEGAVGVFALLSLPLLRHLDVSYAWLGVPHSPWALAALRLGVAALVLLPPTTAMGATLPVVARGLMDRDGTLGRWSAVLYGANTLGAVLGAALCGFWLIPGLGLTRSLVGAGCINLGVAALVLRVGGAARPAAATAPEAVATAVPGATARRVAAVRGRAAFLVFFGVSGFVAIGYEVVWSKVFGIVMEGTLYGFATVLSSYLLGIGVGSLLMARRVDAIGDLPRTFALLHVAVGASVAIGMAAVPWLPYFYERLGAVAPEGGAIYLLWLLVLPIVLVPTALFGAAFPVLIRIYAPSARAAARGIGIATAVNTLGSIAASLLVGFWAIPSLGSDATVYALLMLELGVALLILVHHLERSSKVGLRTLAGAAAVAATVALSFDGIRLEDAVSGRQLRGTSWSGYARGLSQLAASRALSVEGRSEVVTVYESARGRSLRTNGLPEALVGYAPPHYPGEAVALAIWPYLAARDPRRALVIGLGGGNTVAALLATPLAAVDVVELERGVVRAVGLMHEGEPDPLDDPRVHLQLNDGRNQLLLDTLGGAPRYDLITSQPSHPWRVGAANLFTEDFFHIARGALTEGGTFAAWINGFRTDDEALLSVVASFERVFPGSVLVDASGGARHAFLLLGGRRPIELDLARIAERLRVPATASLLSGYHVRGAADLLASIEGPAAAFARLAHHRNTDDNAFVETRAPRMLTWKILDFAAIEQRLPLTTPVLPPIAGNLDVGEVARRILQLAAGRPWSQSHRFARLLSAHGTALDPLERDTLRAEAGLRDPRTEARALDALRALARAHPRSVEPLRALGTHLAAQRRDWAGATAAFAEAWSRSRDARDAYDAGRSLDHADPDRAWAWFERIPAARRGDFPRLAFYAAEHELGREHPSRAALRARYDDLVTFARSAEGHTLPRVHELAARLAWRLGDERAARAHADADAQQRRERASPDLDRAGRQLARGDPAAAERALRRAAALVPSDERLLDLRAEVAFALGDPAAREQALAELRFWAPSEAQGAAAENRLRARHGLPLVADAVSPTASPPGR